MNDIPGQDYCGVRGRVPYILVCRRPVGHSGLHRDLNVAIPMGGLDFEEADAVTGAPARATCLKCGRDTVSGDCYGCEADRQTQEVARLRAVLDRRKAADAKREVVSEASQADASERADRERDRRIAAEVELARISLTLDAAGCQSMDGNAKITSDERIDALVRRAELAEAAVERWRSDENERARRWQYDIDGLKMVIAARNEALRVIAAFVISTRNACFDKSGHERTPT